VPLACAAQGDDHAPAHQPEVAGVDRDRDVRQAADRAVEDARGENLERTFAGPPAARRIDDVVAVAEFGQEVADQFGRILEVAVHQHHRVSTRRVESRGGGDLVAEVARERDHAQVRVGGRRDQQPRQRVVAAPVVDADQLPGGRRFGQLGDDPPDAKQQFVDVHAFVVEWDDHAEGRVGPAADHDVRRGREHLAMFSSLLAVALALASLGQGGADAGAGAAPDAVYRHVGATPPPHGYPVIRELHISSTDLRAGRPVSASVITSENVGYVEARVQNFNAALHQDGPGHFSLSYTVPWWLPFWLRHGYTLQVIARSVDGVEVWRGVGISVR